jgi:hypothetical protein
MDAQQIDKERMGEGETPIHRNLLQTSVRVEPFYEEQALTPRQEGDEMLESTWV